VLGFVSPKPSTVLLVLMLINVTIGAFLSNVASTTLTLSLALPIVRSLNPRDPFIKAILFGSAWSGNCGGMPTTIASPQNVHAPKVIADAGTPVSFLAWLVFAVPVSLLLCVREWFCLTRRFPSGNERFISLPGAAEEPWSAVHRISRVHVRHNLPLDTRRPFGLVHRAHRHQNGRKIETVEHSFSNWPDRIGLTGYSANVNCALHFESQSSPPV
jgi:hypothetical protein